MGGITAAISEGNYYRGWSALGYQRLQCISSYSIKEAVTDLSKQPEWVIPLYAMLINLHDTLDDLGWQLESSKGEEHLPTGINSDEHLEITLSATASRSVPSARKLLC